MPLASSAEDAFATAAVGADSDCSTDPHPATPPSRPSNLDQTTSAAIRPSPDVQGSATGTRAARGLRRVHANLLIALGVMTWPLLATDHFNLESGIPTSLEDIQPTEHGTAELQFYVQYSRLRRGESPGAAQPRLAWGLLERTQLEIATPLLLGGGEATGNGDVELSVLRKLADDRQDSRWPGLAFEAAARVPTGGSRPNFKNRVDAGFTALIRKNAGPHSLHMNIGFDWTGDEREGEELRRTALNSIFGHDMPLTKRLLLVSDVVWRQPDEKRSTSVWLIETGVRAQLSESVIGAVGVGAGLNRGPETPAFCVTAGFQFSLWTD